LVDSSGAAFGEQCTDAAVTQDFMDFRPVDFDFPWSIDLPAGQREYQLQVRWADCPGDCYAGAPMSVDLVARW
jgi:hypothetical protein